uniref:Myb-like domain-containing protein n=1 Tax=Oryza rufipogon TaxID=4529 RepID=A0A0E0PDM8_ORYRU
MEPGCGEGGGGGGGRDERVPQWGAQETRELIAARGEMERESAAAAAARRSAKTLWEAVSARLRERGYRRTAEQCKCKWKNLVNRYKGKETSDPENGRQCPFFDELHAVFTERARTMQQQLLESESGPSVKKKLKRPSGDLSSEDSDDEEDGGGDSGDEKPIRSRKRKIADKRQQSQRMAEKSRTSISSIHELLQDFLVQQQRMDIQWHEMMERRSQERIVFEQEWRQSMQKLEQERLMLEHTWMEREEQRRMREEARAEKRDALLTTLLNKVLQEDL